MAQARTAASRAPQNTQFETRSVLKDPAGRISKEFHVPKALEKRTEFWFDVYTKYGVNHHVLHHSRYPWIIFDVIDTSEIANNPSLHRWTRYHRAKQVVADRRKAVESALDRLSKMSSYKNLKGLEGDLYKKLSSIPGKRQSVFKFARQNLRSQLGQKDFIVSGLRYSSRYLPYMEEEFRLAGLPVELTRIPFVESSFNPHAESKVGASGVWQIMPHVGRAYLRVTDHIDERNSPLKASLAAAALLKANYRSLKDWPLAVTAYNHGATGVRRALKESRSTNLAELVERHYQGAFKFASVNFYASFLAILHAEKYHEEIFDAKDLIDRERPLEFAVFKLDQPIKAKRLAKLIGISSETLVGYNLDLKQAFKNNSSIPKGFRILVPAEQQIRLGNKKTLGLRPVREARNDTSVLSNLRGS
jgi:membrane-bound lytic murein transglycosylase D